MSTKIDENEIGDRGLTSILNSLRNNKTLTAINLSMILYDSLGLNSITGNSKSSIEDFIKDNKTLAVLFLCNFLC